MRTLTIALIAIAGLLALAGSAYAKDPGPLRAEVSGGGLVDPVVLEHTVSSDIIFTHDQRALHQRSTAAVADGTVGRAGRVDASDSGRSTARKSIADGTSVNANANGSSHQPSRPSAAAGQTMARPVKSTWSARPWTR